MSAITDKASTIVTRGGQIVTIDATEIVVGDIVTLKTGEKVPADGVIILASNLACDESAMTGEPDAKKKVQINEQTLNQKPCPFVTMGSLVESGTGRFLVCAVGTKTQLGKMDALLNPEEELTPL